MSTVDLKKQVIQLQCCRISFTAKKILSKIDSDKVRYQITMHAKLYLSALNERIE